MSARPPYWFPLKRYGYGWGLPVCWQGWAVVAVYSVLAVAVIVVFAPKQFPLTFAVYLVALTAVLIVIIAVKGEKPLRWRWGGD